MIGVGSWIQSALSKRRIRMLPVEAGCDCPQIVEDMNALTPAEIREDIDGWAERIRVSARKWCKAKGGLWQLLPTPPLWAARELVELACDRVENSPELPPRSDS